MRSLTSINRFAFGGVGFAGVISQGEVDLNIILSQPTPLAVTTLEKLFATGNPQAKAYALAGVKQLSQNRYVELLAVAKTSSAEGEVMRGCIINREQLQAIAKEIDNGEFHFYHQANRR